MSHMSNQADIIARPRRRKAFTLPELCLGLAVTTLVMGAVGAFSLAIANTWNAGEVVTTVQQAQVQSSVRLQSQISGAEAIGYTQVGDFNAVKKQSGVATVVLWKSDANADGKIQMTEMVLIQHDAADEVLKKYVPVLTDGAADVVVPAAEFRALDVWKYFENYSTPTVLARNVQRARFQFGHKNSTMCRPVVEFVLKVGKGDASGIEYGVAALRGPAIVTESPTVEVEDGKTIELAQ